MKANKVIILFLVNILFFKVSIAQNVTTENVHLDKSYSLYIKLNPKIDIESSEDLSNFILQKTPSLREVYEETSFQLKKGIPLSKDKLEDIENKGLRKRKGKRIGLNNILKVLIENPTQEKLQSLKNRLDKIEAIEYCHLSSNIPIPSPNDIFPETPSFRSLQNYIDQDPGVNMQYAWDNGVDGTGIFVRNLEYGFNKSHEELNDVNAFYAPGRTVNSTAVNYGYTRHGTSVMGILYADNGVYGVTGLVPGVEELILHPEWTEEYVSVDNTFGWDRIAATSEAIANTSAGDVLIYEMQSAEGGPAELDPVLWDLTKAATDAGIIIVAAGGNGGLNLDSSLYNEYRSRGDSGAIIVGAGTPDVNHDALSFSSYGNRVDLQGWGNNVFTSGSNGAVEIIGGDVNQSYTNFNGTSSATAIVASCTVAIQSYYLSNTGLHLTGEEINDILKSTGIPQGASTSSNRPIGPLPNMETALNHLGNIINCSVDIYGNFDNADATYADGDQCTAFPSSPFNAAWNSLFPWKASIYYSAYHVLLTEDFYDDYNCNVLLNQGTGTNIWMNPHRIKTPPSGHESVMAYWNNSKYTDTNLSGVYTQINNLEPNTTYQIEFYDLPVRTHAPGRQTANLYYNTKVSFANQEWNGPDTYYTNEDNYWHLRTMTFTTDATTTSTTLTLQFPLHPDLNNPVNDGYIAIDDINIVCLSTPVNKIQPQGFQEVTVNDLTLHPNPTKGELNITLNTTDDKIQSVVVYNIQGQLILKENAIKQNRLDISQIENGIYFVTIKTSKNKTYTKKIIKI